MQNQKQIITVDSSVPQKQVDSSKEVRVWGSPVIITGLVLVFASLPLWIILNSPVPCSAKTWRINIFKVMEIQTEFYEQSCNFEKEVNRK